MSAIVDLCTAAKDASRVVATLSTESKNALLLDLARALESRRGEILDASARDVRLADAAGLAPAKLQRLGLSEQSLTQMIQGVRQIADLPDPVGQIVKDYAVASGLRVRRVRSPLGVIAMIYEARPGVTIDAFALCFKAGNACILKGGKEAAGASVLLGAIARDALRARGLPEHAITAFTSTDRAELTELLQQDALIDLVIPRGGTDLIRYVARTSRIPTIQHYQGVCHVYVDAGADEAMALKIALTGKTSAPATCNATECVLVHQDIAAALVPALAGAYARAGVQVRGDARVRALAPGVTPASDDDFGREFLDLIVAMKIVNSMDEAIEHIHRYTSNHTEVIVTRSDERARAFCQRVQSSCVLVNASTRLNDGFQLGLGAEIGISTSKIHAYGPMGLEELTTTRFVVSGDGQTR